MQKLSSIHTIIQSILGSHELNGRAHFWPHPPKPLAFLNLHQHARNQFIPSIHSWDTVNFRVMWPDWPYPFLTKSTQKVKWIWLAENILAQISGTKIIYINVHYWTNSVKINDKTSQKIWKALFLAHFWSILPIFGKSSSVMYNFIWVSSTMPKFRKNEWYNSMKTLRETDGQMKGQKDGQTRSKKQKKHKICRDVKSTENKTT